MFDPYIVLLLEIAIVLLVGFIRVPGWWADVLWLELIGSVAAWAWIGLAVWLLFAGCAWLLLTHEPPKAGWITVALDFLRHHPLLAIAFGPLIAIQLRLSSSFNDA